MQPKFTVFKYFVSLVYFDLKHLSVSISFKHVVQLSVSGEKETKMLSVKSST